MPELFARPLLATRADGRLYEPRAAVDDALRHALEHSRNALVVGEHGSGRTSLLHASARELRERRQQAVYVDGRAADDAVELVRMAADAIRRAGPIQPAPGGAAPVASSVLDALRELPPTGLVVMLDDPPADAAFELFGRHRDRLWDLDYVWIVATTPDAAVRLAAPPADAFFDRRIDVLPLNAAEKHRVLSRRAPEFEAEAAETLARRGPDNLRAFVVAAARIADGDLDADTYTRGVDERRRRAQELGRSAAVALDEVEALEPVSASDPRLLERLGWTKARASRVLNDLEDADLVEAKSVPAGPGRPPKLYRTRPPELFA